MSWSLIFRSCVIVAICIPVYALAADQSIASGDEQSAASKSVDQAMVNRLVKQLGSPEFQKREQASAALVRLGAPAVPAVLRAVYSSDSEVTKRAYRVIDAMKRSSDTKTSELARAAHRIAGNTKTAEEADRALANHDPLELIVSEIQEDRGWIKRDRANKIITVCLKGQKAKNEHFLRASLLPDVKELILEYTWQLTPDTLSQLHRYQSLESITFISVRKMKDENLGQLAKLKKLHTLTLHGIEFTWEGLAHVGQTKTLRTLNIMFSKHVTDDDLAKLKSLSQLRTLRLYHFTKLKGPGLAHLKELKHLESLDLRDSAVTDEAVVHLKEMKSLRRLQLERSKISATGVKALQQALPNCRITGAGQTVKAAEGDG